MVVSFLKKFKDSRKAKKLEIYNVLKNDFYFLKEEYYDFYHRKLNLQLSSLIDTLYSPYEENYARFGYNLTPKDKIRLENIKEAYKFLKNGKIADFLCELHDVKLSEINKILENGENFDFENYSSSSKHNLALVLNDILLYYKANNDSRYNEKLFKPISEYLRRQKMSPDDLEFEDRGKILFLEQEEFKKLQQLNKEKLIEMEFKKDPKGHVLDDSVIKKIMEDSTLEEALYEVVKKDNIEGKENSVVAIKTVRFGKWGDVWGSYLMSITQKEQLEQGKELEDVRQKIRSGNAVYNKVYNYKVKAKGVVDKKVKQYSAEQKGDLSKKNSMILISLYRKFFPPAFGSIHQVGPKKEELVGVVFFSKDINDDPNLLPGEILKYEEATFDRPFRFLNYYAAIQYAEDNVFNKKNNKGIIFASPQELFENVSADDYNETLMRTKWTRNDPRCQLGIFSNNLKSRIIAQLRAIDLKINLNTQFIPICFYDKYDLNKFRGYKLDKQKTDLTKALASTEDPELKAMAQIIAIYNQQLSPDTITLYEDTNNIYQLMEGDKLTTITKVKLLTPFLDRFPGSREKIIPLINSLPRKQLINVLAAHPCQFLLQEDLSIQSMLNNFLKEKDDFLNLFLKESIIEEEKFMEKFAELSLKTDPTNLTLAGIGPNNFTLAKLLAFKIALNQNNIDAYKHLFVGSLDNSENKANFVQENLTAISSIIKSLNMDKNVAKNLQLILLVLIEDKDKDFELIDKLIADFPESTIPMLLKISAENISADNNNLKLFQHLLPKIDLSQLLELLEYTQGKGLAAATGVIKNTEKYKDYSSSLPVDDKKQRSKRPMFTKLPLIPNISTQYQVVPEISLPTLRFSDNDGLNVRVIPSRSRRLGHVNNDLAKSEQELKERLLKNLQDLSITPATISPRTISSTNAHLAANAPSAAIAPIKEKFRRSRKRLPGNNSLENQELLQALLPSAQLTNKNLKMPDKFKEQVNIFLQNSGKLSVPEIEEFRKLLIGYIFNMELASLEVNKEELKTILASLKQVTEIKNISDIMMKNNDTKMKINILDCCNFNFYQQNDHANYLTNYELQIKVSLAILGYVIPDNLNIGINQEETYSKLLAFLSKTNNNPGVTATSSNDAQASSSNYPQETKRKRNDI